MRTKRSVESQSFLRTRTSGHLLAALALEAGGALDVPPTVEVKDYPAAKEAMVEMNNGALKNKKSKELQSGTSGTRSSALLPSTPTHLLMLMQWW